MRCLQERNKLLAEIEGVERAVGNLQRVSAVVLQRSSATTQHSL